MQRRLHTRPGQGMARGMVPAKRAKAVGVELPEGASGSTFLLEILAHAVNAFPSVFQNVKIPSDSRRFRSTFGTVLTQFEAARVASDERVAIASAIRSRVAERMRFVSEDESRTLADALSRKVAPIPVRVVKTTGPGRLVPAVQFGDAVGDAAALRVWLSAARLQHQMTDAAVRALGKILDRADAENGLSLAGERFVVMGAGAELAPTEALLAAGASVLWIDVREPSKALLENCMLGGALHVPESTCDLLASPAAIVATIAAFAGGESVHLGMYAYAGGESQEWRLAESMNAIAAALPPGMVKSISLLVSPTTVIAAHPADVEAGAQRRQDAGTLMRSLAHFGFLEPSHVSSPSSSSVTSAIVGLQGASYQAAQYVGKLLAAEVFGVSGINALGPLTTSANIAPITATRSLSHPLFEAGFLFAPNFGVWVAKPETTRALHALLMIADVTDEEAPAAAGRVYESKSKRAAALFTEQVHGGVYAQPYALEGIIRIAALGGLRQKPSLLAKLVRSIELEALLRRSLSQPSDAR